MSDKKDRNQFNVNLPGEVLRLWNKRRKGLSNTKMSLAGLFAYLVLDKRQQDCVEILARRVIEGKKDERSLTEALDWCEAEKARAGKVREEGDRWVDEMEEPDAAKQTRRAAKKKREMDKMPRTRPRRKGS